MGCGQRDRFRTRNTLQSRVDDIFCPELVSGQLRAMNRRFPSTPGEQFSHSAQVIFVSDQDKVRPTLDGALFRVGVAGIERLNLDSTLAF
jgi:hypothetical protein